MKLYKTKTHLISGIISLFFIFLAFGSGEDQKSTSETASSAIDTMSNEKLKEILNRELKSFDKPFNGSNYRSDLASVQIEMAVLGAWGNFIRKGLASDDKEVLDLAKKLKLKVSSLQKTEFPQMRKACTKLLAEKMWENDMYISSEGAPYTTLNLTAGVFAANKNIKQIQTTLYEALVQYRFKQTRYRWYKDQDEFTYYTIESPNDDEIVNL